MKREDISDAIGLIDDELITQVEKTRKKHGTRKHFYMAGTALAACLCLVISMNINRSNPVNAFTIAEAKYPAMEQYPDIEKFTDKNGDVDYEAYTAQEEKWSKNQTLYQENVSGTNEQLETFMTSSTKEFLANAKDENVVYSPFNVYLALSMLAEVSGEDSREEILHVLGEDSIESLRKHAESLWKANYCNDGATTSILANSLWLDNEVKYNQKTMDTLAKNYYASAYRGEMGSDEYTKRLQDWLNKQTGNLLKDQVDGLNLDPEAIMSLISTVYFQAKWDSEFDGNATVEEVFHANSGDVQCDFMHQSKSGTYYYGDKYSAIEMQFVNGGSMWLILPDKGVTTDELIENNTVMSLPIHGGTYKDLLLNISMPKFDVSSDLDLVEGLKTLGVNKVFDSTSSDFSPMAEGAENVYVSQVKHAARVQVDEEGCTAAAFTKMELCGAAGPPDDEIDFVLDRPFLFVITGNCGTPLFTGVVNQPIN